MTVEYVKRFAEALKADPTSHHVGCHAWERRTGASLGLAPETLLELCSEVTELRTLVNDIEAMTIHKSNKMPDDFRERISEGMKLHHRRRKIAKAEREVLEAVMQQWGAWSLRKALIPQLQEACEALDKVRDDPQDS